MSTPIHLLLPRQFYDAMLMQAQAELPNECCGLLAGRIENGVGRVEIRYPLVNERASPREYFAAPFDAHKDMRDKSIDILAIYHSHPTSEPVPSKKDLADNFHGNCVVHFIIGLFGGAPIVRGWWLTETDFVEANWQIVE